MFLINFIGRVSIIVLCIMYIPIFLLKKMMCINRVYIKKDILVINNAKIGDLVCSSPVFREIKKVYPESKITLIINKKTLGIIKNNPNIDSIIYFPKSSVKELFYFFKEIANKDFFASVNLVPGTFNYVVPFISDIPIRISTTAKEYGLYYSILVFLTVNHRKIFHKNTLSVKHYLDLLSPLGIFNTSLKKEVFLREGSISSARYILRDYLDKPNCLVGFSITAGNKIKEWPLEYFFELCKEIYLKYRFVPVIIGGPSDKVVVEKIMSLLKKSNINSVSVTDMSLEDIPAIISLLDYFISVDTGTLYIANALDVPVLDIAGPCNIYDQMPIYEMCEVVYVKNLPGWPYSSVLKTVTSLDKEQMRCIYELTPKIAMDGFDKLVKKNER